MRLPVARRACCLLIVLASISPASRSAAQHPPDLVVTLATSDGRTTFRIGETIPVELRVRASAPGTYQYHTFTWRRAWYDTCEQSSPIRQRASWTHVRTCRTGQAQFQGLLSDHFRSAQRRWSSIAT